MTLGIVISILVFFTIVIGLMAFIAYMYIKYLKEKEANEQLRFYASIDVNKCAKILDDLVEKEFNDYQKFHPEMIAGNAYLKREDITSIISDITARVYVDITPAIHANLSLIYDIDTKEKIVNLIGEKVGILVMALAATLNSQLIDDSSNIKQES